jgi:hypothetical protein
MRTIKSYRTSGRDASANKLELLLSKILEWRDAAAATLHMAPGSVLAEHLAYKIA